MVRNRLELQKTRFVKWKTEKTKIHKLKVRIGKKKHAGGKKDNRSIGHNKKSFNMHN